MSWGWLSELLSRFFDLIPMPVVVRPDQTLVEFLFGKYVRVFRAGYYVEWNFIASYEVVPMMRQPGEVKQDLFIDERPLQVTTTFGWQVKDTKDDVKNFVLKCDDYLGTVEDIVKQAVANLNSEDLELPQSSEIHNECVERLSLYGIDLTDLEVTGQAPVRALNITGTLETG